MTDFHISRETEKIRDDILISKFGRIEELVKKPGFAEYYKLYYRGQDIDVLSNKLLTLHKMVEEGKIKEKDQEKVELQMICCCLAIEDEIRELILLKREELSEDIIER